MGTEPFRLADEAVVGATRPKFPLVASVLRRSAHQSRSRRDRTFASDNFWIRGDVLEARSGSELALCALRFVGCVRDATERLDTRVELSACR